MYANLDCDHPLVKKVNELTQKGEKYVLTSDEERELVKILVNREFLYYAGDYDHVGCYDLRKFNMTCTPPTETKRKPEVSFDDDIDS